MAACERGNRVTLASIVAISALLSRQPTTTTTTHAKTMPTAAAAAAAMRAATLTSVVYVAQAASRIDGKLGSGDTLSTTRR